MIKLSEEEKTNTNENGNPLNNLPNSNLSSAMIQPKFKENKLKIKENYDLTLENNSSSDEWKEEKSQNKDVLKKKRLRPNERHSKSKSKVKYTKIEEYNEEEKEREITPMNYSNNFNNINNDNKFEKEALFQLVNIEGFNKIFGLLSKPYFNRKNPLERKIDEIICNIGLLRTSLILMQIKFDSYDASQNIIPNFSPLNFNGYNFNSVNSYTGSQAPLSYPPPMVPLSVPNSKMNVQNLSETEDKDKEVDIVLDENEDREKSVDNKNKKLKNQKEMDKDGYELGEHLHKESGGKIYKYLKHHMRVTKGFVFNCADRKCKSKGLYDIETMNFKIILKHTIPYEQHNYIMNKSKFNQYKTIFEDFNKRNCTEAQVFKNEAGNKLVKWYSN